MKKLQKDICRGLLSFALTCILFVTAAHSQDSKPYVRIAKIVIDDSQVDAYNKALKIHAEAAVKREPGVLTLYAVHDKDNPARVTVFEIYKDVPAYQFHIKTKHFLTYKTTVEKMVKSLELTDVVPIAMETK